MTRDIGEGLANYFSLETRDCLEVGDDSYLQSSYDNSTDSYSLLFRENGRYGSPVELCSGISQEEDVDQLLVAVEDGGFPMLRKALEEGEH